MFLSAIPVNQIKLNNRKFIIPFLTLNPHHFIKEEKNQPQDNYSFIK